VLLEISKLFYNSPCGQQSLRKSFKIIIFIDCCFVSYFPFQILLKDFHSTSMSLSLTLTGNHRVEFKLKIVKQLMMMMKKNIKFDFIFGLIEIISKSFENSLIFASRCTLFYGGLVGQRIQK
jgi:hypothetical protein